MEDFKQMKITIQINNSADFDLAQHAANVARQFIDGDYRHRIDIRNCVFYVGDSETPSPHFVVYWTPSGDVKVRVWRSK